MLVTLWLVYEFNIVVKYVVMTLIRYEPGKIHLLCSSGFKLSNRKILFLLNSLLLEVLPFYLSFCIIMRTRNYAIIISSRILVVTHSGSQTNRSKTLYSSSNNDHLSVKSKKLSWLYVDGTRSRSTF